MITGYLAAFGYVFLLLVGVYCFGYAARTSSLLHVLLLESGLGFVLIGSLLLWENGFAVDSLFTKPSTANYGWLGSAAVIGFAGGNYFTLLNLRTAGEKINSLLSPAITAFTIILSCLFFHDRPAPLQWAGIVLTLLVVLCFLLVLNRQGKKGSDPKAGAWSGVATVACISLGIICSIKGAGGAITYLHAIWLRLLFALPIAAGAFMATRGHRAVKPQGTRFYAAVLTGVVAQTIVAGYLWLHASFTIGVPVFQIIIATFPLWVYAVDVYGFKKSRPSASFLVAALLAAAGVCLSIL